MKREIREKRDKLRMESSTLQKLALDERVKNNFELRKKQDEAYKKWDFYDKMIKAMERS